MVHTYAPTTEELVSLDEETRAKWRAPRSFTAIIPVAGVDVETLHDRLRKLKNIYKKRVATVDDCHSFRLCAIPEDNVTIGRTCLLLNSVHDAPVPEHIASVVSRIGDLLRQSIQLNQLQMSDKDLCAYLLRHRVREDAVYLGSVNLTVKQILQEENLYGEVKKIIASGLSSNRWNLDDPESIRRAVRNVFLTANNTPVREMADKLSWQAHFHKWIDLMRMFVLFPAIGILAGPIERKISEIPNKRRQGWRWFCYACWWIVDWPFSFAGLWLARLLERLEPKEKTSEPIKSRVRQLETEEDLSPKNAVTIVFSVRNSWIRRFSLKLILLAAELGSRHLWNEGKLTGITTIHYARLIQINQGRRLLFMSDYDGSLSRYLDDFLSVGKIAVLAFTSNLVGCPKTKGLLEVDSPEDFGPAWKQMIRSYQRPTAVWYSAYPNLTVKEILNNAAQRKELFSERLSDKELQRWLRRL